MISVDTKLVGLLGKPLRQSFSARIQNEAYAALGLDLYYFPIEVEPDGVPAVLSAVRKMNFAGLGVTKPYKLAVIPYLDALDETAALLGAVNTVIKDGDRLIGSNTDGCGFMRGLREAWPRDLSKETVLNIGTGGAGRAICLTLAKEGVGRLLIANRTAEKAEALAREINERVAPIAEPVPFEPGALANAAAGCQIVMNNTGLGMPHNADQTPVDGAIFRPGTLAFDATYNPAKTRFLREAEARGAQTLNGMDMLIYQGVRQVELWTGNPNAAPSMRKTARQIADEMAAR